MKHEINVPKGCKVVSVETTNEMVVVKFEKDEPKFKENDIVTCERDGNKWIAIYKSEKDTTSFDAKVVYSIADRYFSKVEDYANYGDSCRLSTDSEKQLLFDKLKGKCLMFDGENVVRWRAEPDNIYYCVDSDGVMNDEESCDVLDDIRYKNGNYFPTYKMAESFQKQYIDLLNNFHKNL